MLITDVKAFPILLSILSIISRCASLVLVGGGVISGIVASATGDGSGCARGAGEAEERNWRIEKRRKERKNAMIKLHGVH